MGKENLYHLAEYSTTRRQLKLTVLCLNSCFALKRVTRWTNVVRHSAITSFDLIRHMQMNSFDIN